MGKVIAIFEDNWADEMDVQGFVILTEKRWEAYKASGIAKNRRFSLCVGSNEDIEYQNGKELLKNIKVRPITNEEEKTITKIFGDSFGTTNFLSYLESEDEYDEEEEDDE